MSIGAETLTEFETPQEDWRDRLIQIYEEQGFYQHAVLPQPPTRPTLRIVKPRSTYDYRTEELPWKSKADEVEAANYAFLNRSLIRRYGHDNVRSAYPTAQMIQEHPEYGEQPHSIFMVRPAENIPAEELAPVETDEQSLLKQMVARLARAKS